MNGQLEKIRNTIKNAKIDIKTQETDQKVYWAELIITFTFTMITSEAKMKFPSKSSPPI